MKILIDDDISPWYGVTADRINRQLKSATGDVDVEISSDGGDVFEAVRIFNLLKNYKRGTITTTIIGQACSAASYIFLAGENRIVFDNSIYMIHNASNGLRGDYRAMLENSDFLKRVTDISIREYAKVSGRSASDIEKELDAESWFFGQEIIDSGFATEIKVSGDIDSLNKADAVVGFKEKSVACDMRNSEECLKNFQADGYSEKIKQMNGMLDDLSSSTTNQHKEQPVEKANFNDVKIFLVTATTEEKATMMKALGGVDATLLTAKKDEMVQLVATHKVALTNQNPDFATHIQASMKEAVLMLSDAKFDKVEATEKEKAMDLMAFSQDGKVSLSDAKIHLLEATMSGSAPQAGENHKENKDPYAEFADNQTKMGEE